MLIFALDSTATAASVAICEDDRPLATYTLQNGNTHSETLLPMAQSLFSTLSLTPADVDLFACTVGPGSFTGVRIGAATIKGLSFGSDRPCVGVSSLESLAYPLSTMGGLICPVINARKFLYFALFTTKDSRLVRLCEDQIVAVTELESTLSSLLATLPADVCAHPITLTGDGCAAAQRALSTLEHTLQVAPPHLREQNPVCIAQLAKEQYERGQFCSDSALTPVYLRPCQAERELLERANQS